MGPKGESARDHDGPLRGKDARARGHECHRGGRIRIPFAFGSSPDRRGVPTVYRGPIDAYIHRATTGRAGWARPHRGPERGPAWRQLQVALDRLKASVHRGRQQLGAASFRLPSGLALSLAVVTETRRGLRNTPGLECSYGVPTFQQPPAKSTLPILVSLRSAWDCIMYAPLGGAVATTTRTPGRGSAAWGRLPSARRILGPELDSQR